MTQGVVGFIVLFLQQWIRVRSMLALCVWWRQAPADRRDTAGFNVNWETQRQRLKEITVYSFLCMSSLFLNRCPLLELFNRNSWVPVDTQLSKRKLRRSSHSEMCLGFAACWSCIQTEAKQSNADTWTLCYEVVVYLEAHTLKQHLSKHWKEQNLDFFFPPDLFSCLCLTTKSENSVRESWLSMWCECVTLQRNFSLVLTGHMGDRLYVWKCAFQWDICG